MTRNYASPDLTYATANPSVWSCVEAIIAITSACLPSLWPVFTAIGATHTKLKSKHPDSLSFSSRRIDFSNGRPKSNGGVPQLRKESSETSDKVKLHHVVDIHPITERNNFLDLSTERNTSRTGSDGTWNAHPEVPQNWGYPTAMDIGKERTRFDT